jgi:hypothetical protein
MRCRYGYCNYSNDVSHLTYELRIDKVVISSICSHGDIPEYIINILDDVYTEFADKYLHMTNPHDPRVLRNANYFYNF